MGKLHLRAALAAAIILLLCVSAASADDTAAKNRALQAFISTGKNTSRYSPDELLNTAFLLSLGQTDRLKNAVPKETIIKLIGLELNDRTFDYRDSPGFQGFFDFLAYRYHPAAADIAYEFARKGYHFTLAMIEQIRAEASEKTLQRVGDGLVEYYQRYGELAVPYLPEDPVCMLARVGPLDALEKLIDSGADVNTMNDRGESALSIAVSSCDLSKVAYLRSKGALLSGKLWMRSFKESNVSRMKTILGNFLVLDVVELGREFVPLDRFSINRFKDKIAQEAVARTWSVSGINDFAANHMVELRMVQTQAANAYSFMGADSSRSRDAENMMELLKLGQTNLQAIEKLAESNAAIYAALAQAGELPDSPPVDRSHVTYAFMDAAGKKGAGDGLTGFLGRRDTLMRDFSFTVYGSDQKPIPGFLEVNGEFLTVGDGAFSYEAHGADVTSFKLQLVDLPVTVLGLGEGKEWIAASPDKTLSYPDNTPFKEIQFSLPVGYNAFGSCLDVKGIMGDYIFDERKQQIAVYTPNPLDKFNFEAFHMGRGLVDLSFSINGEDRVIRSGDLVDAGGKGITSITVRSGQKLKFILRDKNKNWVEWFNANTTGTLPDNGLIYGLDVTLVP